MTRPNGFDFDVDTPGKGRLQGRATTKGSLRPVLAPATKAPERAAAFRGMAEAMNRVRPEWVRDAVDLAVIFAFAFAGFVALAAFL